MLDWIYPRNCIGCGVPSPDPLLYICWDCLADVSRIDPPFCSCCGDPVAGDIQHDYICFACSRDRPAFEQARSAVRYEGIMGRALRALKYEAALWMVNDLSQALFDCVRAEYPEAIFDCVAAVPLHPSRCRERGFNQSILLGRALARRLALPFNGRLLRRIRPSVSQTGLTAPQRAANVSNTFKTCWCARVEGRRILLVDDVMTTGATVRACARALKKGGAASVHVVTVARG